MNLENKSFHFIAIGGVGMSALAKYLVERGAKVTGSDVVESKYTHLLENKGVKVTIGHDANLINKEMIVVASSAIKDSNVEIIRAKELGLKIYHRSDILKMISDEFSSKDTAYFIGYAGTHGKTTTSGLCSYVLNKAGLNPSFVVGGIIPELNTNGEFSDETYFSAELDESDGTIQKYATDISVINNMDEDHLDYYKNGFSDIALTFNKFLSNKPEQKVIINIDNDGNQKFMEMYPDYKYITFGLNNADYTAKNISFIGFGSKFDIFKKEIKIDTIELTVPGLHNVYNALAVYVSLKEANVDMKKISEHFKTFTGMGRRFQKVAEINNIAIYDDYAHHPNEIKTTLESASNAKSINQRIVAIFQPHRYSRLQGLWNDFKLSFDTADKLIITDVYSAGEEKIENVDSENFSKDIKHSDCKHITGTMDEVANKLAPQLKENDIVITLGAGTITQLGKLLEKELKR